MNLKNPSPAKAINNLSRAIAQQTNEDQFPEVAKFLGSISLDKYIPKFTENGVEDLETILELNDTHLDAMGVPLGYKLKILKQIKAVRL